MASAANSSPAMTSSTEQRRRAIRKRRDTTRRYCPSSRMASGCVKSDLVNNFTRCKRYYHTIEKLGIIVGFTLSRRVYARFLTTKPALLVTGVVQRCLDCLSAWCSQARAFSNTGPTGSRPFSRNQQLMLTVANKWTREREQCSRGELQAITTQCLDAFGYRHVQTEASEEGFPFETSVVNETSLAHPVFDHHGLRPPCSM
ncbi:hypothetical protein B0T10DRAFT_542241 [Thelonectria olida]|uniref:Uncharacterized protein n=1 Tax=Thelonectria olida TaxID=1576542 RepID=A0A9P9AVZ9_9HYPO|nr:hypothetical protein B0T10DRAFT_542241 [Thelonectria olida]